LWRGAFPAIPIIERIDLFLFFTDIREETSMATRIPMNKQDVVEKEHLRKLELNTSEIGLTVRTTNCLEEQGIFTVEHLLHCSREELLGISNFGEKTLEEVFHALEKLGFYRRHRCPQHLKNQGNLA